MRLVVNGEEQDIAAATLGSALAALELGDATVATAVNGEFVPKRARESTPLRDGDRIEIVAPRQGG
jgi:sulfur carrier protein